METENIFAAFVVAPAITMIRRPLVAATTRAVDHCEFGKIGLPGSKVNESESARDAALRGCEEKGWAITGLADKPYHTAVVYGKPIAWFAASSAKVLPLYKEQKHILPMAVTAKSIAQLSYDNEVAMAAWAQSVGWTI